MWWGYEHEDGSLHVNQHRGAGDTRPDEARRSPHVRQVVGPFEAHDRAKATEVIMERLA